MIAEEICRYNTLLREYYYRLGQPVPDEAINLLKMLIPYELDFKKTWSGLASILNLLEYDTSEIENYMQFMIDNYKIEKRTYPTEGETHVGNNYPVTDITYSPSGKTLACSTADNKVYLLDMDEEKITYSFENEFGGIGEVSLTKEHLAYITENNQVIVWKFPLVKIHKIFRGNHYAITDNDIAIVISCADGTIASYLLASGLEMGRVQFSRDPATNIASSNYDYVATSHLARILLWSSVLGLEGILDGHRNKVTAIKFHENKRVLATGSSDCNIILWDIVSKKEIRTLTGHQKSIKCLAFSPNEEILASVSDDNKIILWDTNTGNMIQENQGNLETISCITFTRDGKTITSGSMTGTIKFWGEIINLK